MSNLEPELEELKESLLEMTSLVITQIEKCRDVINEKDLDLAEEIRNADKRVNAMELKIDRDCENILALYNPVAVDLRFVLAGLKINHDLERIGDNARGIAKHCISIGKKIDSEILKKFRINEMFNVTISMLEDVYKALEKEDSKLARRIFQKDNYLDSVDNKAITVANNFVKQFPEKVKSILGLYSIVRKLERVGDLTTNLAEEIIFHLEAKVLKHGKNKKRMKKEMEKLYSNKSRKTPPDTR